MQLLRMNFAVFCYVFSDRCNLFCKRRDVLVSEKQLWALEVFIFQTETLCLWEQKCQLLPYQSCPKIPDDSIRKKGKGSEQNRIVFSWHASIPSRHAWKCTNSPKNSQEGYQKNLFSQNIATIFQGSSTPVAQKAKHGASHGKVVGFITWPAKMHTLNPTKVALDKSVYQYTWILTVISSC